MTVDTPRGAIEYFEDFLVTATGDLGEVDIQSATGVTTAILANQLGGVIELPVATSNDDDVAAVTTNLNWQVESGGLVGEVRFKFDTSIADPYVFVGFGDSIATADETSFGASADVYDILTMTDGIGFVFDNDATTKRWVCVAGKADVLTHQTILGSRFNPALNTYYTFRVFVATDGKYAQWSINGEVVKELLSTSTIITPTAALALGVWAYEQGTALEVEVDYLYAKTSRDSGDN